jgi:hypothetical protein
MRGDEESIHADAYIDSLLSRPLTPAVLADYPLDRRLERAIELLTGLPRFHPSFAFEESLAARLREAAAGPTGNLAEVIELPLAVGGVGLGGARDAASASGSRQATFAGIDRRLLVGGAIASGVSLAGIARIAYAWLHRTAGSERSA